AHTDGRRDDKSAANGCEVIELQVGSHEVELGPDPTTRQLDVRRAEPAAHRVERIVTAIDEPARRQPRDPDGEIEWRDRILNRGPVPAKTVAVAHVDESSQPVNLFGADFGDIRYGLDGSVRADILPRARQKEVRPQWQPEEAIGAEVPARDLLIAAQARRQTDGHASAEQVAVLDIGGEREPRVAFIRRDRVAV